MDLHELETEYEIIGELGRGGTSIVYHARERELGRDVAIKVVRASHAEDEEAAARLAREAKLVALLRHPNIVPLLGIRHLSDGLALIMQHVPGRTLKRTIREDGPLPIALVEHVLREVGSALDYAHKRHGIIHRDIKPENIYLDEEVGHALLSDFGIARMTESESNLTLVGTALGTPAYMSPEQIDGTTLDGRSDLYSLGLVAHEMLSGQQPWAGNNLYTIIYKQKHEELPPLTSFRPDIPVYLLRAVESLLRKDPATRCADGGELLAQLPSGGSMPRLAPTPARPAAPQPVTTDEEAPTLRYQRPAFALHDAAVVPVNEPAPLPEPGLSPEPAIAAMATVAAVVDDATAAPVIELPRMRPNWRRNVPRGRGGLAPGGAFAAVEEAAAVNEMDAAATTIPARKRKNVRLVAGITLALMLSGSATVVAMRNVRTAASHDEGAPAEPSDNGALVKASMGSIALESALKPKTKPSASNTTQTASAVRPPAEEEAAEPAPIKLPSVNVPVLDPGSANRLTGSDFARVVTPTSSVDEVPSTPAFTPHTVKPELKNRADVQRVLADAYPAILRERNVGGMVRLWVLIDTAGKVIRSELNQSSGNPMLDRAAVRVADAMQFTPALNRDRKVSVWIQLPVNFRTQ
ncbi:MAG TPA: TonB family protein [Longimicrobiales bacterium]|nr:TonB family protein [Longimicrobiales bacterium]